MKHEKVTKKIKGHADRSVVYNSSEIKRNPNDECYTPIEPILNELRHYGNKLRGKDIICPCDCDIFNDNDDVYSFKLTFNQNSEEDFFSETFEEFKPEMAEWPDEIETYLKNNFEINSVALAQDGQQSLFVSNENINSRCTDFEGIKEIIRTKIVCNFIKALYQIGTAYGIKSITASGYNPEKNTGKKFQEVDYSSYDVCVTNPPFSLYGDFMDIMVREERSRRNSDRPFNYIVLAPFMNRANPCIGLNLMLRNCYLGYNNYMGINFQNPDKLGNLKSKGVVVDWITSYPDAQLERNKTKYHTNIKYLDYKDDYKVMTDITMKDGTHPIHVSINTIPDDYDGWMFGPITVLNKLSTDEFDWYLTNAKKYFNSSHPELNPCAHRLSDTMFREEGSTRNGFHGILFKRKVK